MKLNKFRSYLALLGLCAGCAMAPLRGAEVEVFTPNPTTATPADFVEDPPSSGNWYVRQNFSAYQGSSGTLPTGVVANGIYDNAVFGGLQWGDFDNGNDAAAGFYSYANPTTGSPSQTNPAHWSTNRSFGFLEASGFKDTRMFVKFKNTTPSSLQRVLVNYDVQQWRKGARDNSISLKYNTVHTGFSSITELVNTVAPVSGTTAPLALDGTLGANSVSVTKLVQFPAALGTNSTAFFRWQYSSPGSGSRDGLSVTNVEIKRLELGTNNTWAGAANDVWTAANKWTSPTTWASGNTAVFSNAATSPVNVQSAISATDLTFNQNFTISSTAGTPSITLGGIITVAATKVGTISVPLDSVHGLLKFGTGEVILNAANTSTKGVSVYEGSMTLGANGTIDPTNRLVIGGGATFNLNDRSTTVDGLVGAETSTVTFGNGANNTLMLDLQTSSTASYRGAITGTSATDTLVKTGPGVQRFRATTKGYSAKTQVDEGSLELTQNSGLPNTAAVTLNGVTSTNPLVDDVHGDLLLSNDGSAGGAKSFTLGSSVNILVKGGSITADGSDDITLTNNITLDDTDVTDVTLAHNNINASGTNTVFTLSGVISGEEFRKTGKGRLILTGANTHLATEVRNGIVEATTTASLPGTQLAGHELFFQDKVNTRTLEVKANTTVTNLDGNTLDPEDPADVDAFVEEYGLLPEEMFATARIAIPSGATFTVDLAGAEFTDPMTMVTDELKPSYQGDIIELDGTSGTFIKEGTGTLRFTVWPKTFAGTINVNDGVLQLSDRGRVVGTGITVNHQPSVTTGGQVRLSTGGPDVGSAAVYALGGPLVLKSTARSTDGVITGGSNYGILGGLRFDPDTGVQYADFQSEIQIAEASDIHVNGLDKVLIISGNLTGSAALNRSGGGRVDLTGTVSGYTGTMTLSNGVTRIAESKTFGGSVNVAVSTAEISFDGVATISGTVSVVSGGQVNYRRPAGSPTAVTVTGNVTLSNGWVLNLDGSTVTAGTTFTLFTSTATKTVTPGAITLINPPAGVTTATVSVVGNDIRITVN